MPSHTYKLPGHRVTVATRIDWIRSMAHGAYLVGPRRSALMRAARSGDRADLHREERRWAQAAARALKLTIDVSGLHHVDPATSYVVLPLHEGFADLIAVSQLPLAMVYPAAEELFDWDHLGPYLSASGQPRISRANGARAYRSLLRAGTTAVARGESIVVFPQGTIVGIESSFAGGAFRLARSLGMPVLPVVLTGAATVWDYPFSTLLHRYQTIHMEVLAPVPADQAVVRAHEIESTMKDRALAASPAPRRYVPERDGWWDGYRIGIDDRFPELAARVQAHRDTHQPTTAGHAT